MIEKLIYSSISISLVKHTIGIIFSVLISVEYYFLLPDNENWAFQIGQLLKQKCVPNKKFV